jgi:CHAD domain-containing protein
MGQRLYFEIPVGWTQRELFSNLGQKFKIKLRPVQHEVIRYYDSFDWRLYLNQMSLSWDGEHLFLVTDGPRYSELDCRYNQEPKFVNDLPDGRVRRRLSGLIEFRALLPLLAIKRAVRTVKFLDAQDKTVCIGFYEKNNIARDHLHKRFKPLFSITPLQGYTQWVDPISTWIQSNGGRKIEAGFYYRALQKVGILPDQHLLKSAGRFAGVTPVLRAIQIILQQQWIILERNEEGIQKDIDTEFLHDFRVAVRRMRSLIGNLKSYLEVAVHSRAEKDFTFLIKLTNLRRDLDIFLHKQSGYLQFLPPRHRRAIVPFFDYLKTRREKEQKKIVRFLMSAEYKSIKLYWKNLIQGKSVHFRKMGKRPVKIQTVIPPLILRRYKKTVRLNQNLPDNPPDEFLHRVRIACKKLRYILEFFQYADMLRPAKTIIKKLRNLQDTLGEYNDLRLQQQRVYRYLQSLERQGKSLPATVKALQYLGNRLQHQKYELQVIFREQFTDFCQPAWQRKITEMLNSTKST